MTTITVYAPGHYDMADSYGLIACQIARHLTRLGVRVNAVGMGETVMASQPDDIRAITAQPIQPSLGGIVLGYPTGYAQQSTLLFHGPRVAITMFESSRLPSGWVEPLNNMDAVIVPSWFCADVFRACGVTAPIHVVPLGVGEVYRYAEREKSTPHDGGISGGKHGVNGGKHGVDRPLTFLAFLDRGARKGGLVALQAFLRAFGDDTAYRLILKTRKPRQVLELTNANIEVIQRDMDEQELYELYLSADVLINPHKGEGFGLIPREFAATGGIALTTNWSGTVDGLSEWGWSLPYTLEPADWRGNKTLEGQDLGEWAAPDVNGVAQRLTHVAEHIDAYRMMAVQHAAHVRRMYCWRTFAEQTLSIWKEVAVGERDRMATA